MQQQEDACMIIQRTYRCHLARKETANRVRAIVSKCFDETTGMVFYYHWLTGDSSWEKPKLLFGYDIDEIEEPSEEKKEEKEEKNENEENEEKALECKEADLILDEPGRAPRPATERAILDAWKIVMPNNPLHGLPCRYDVYVADSPQRCAVVQGIDLSEERKRISGQDEGWKLTEVFFAYDRNVPGTSPYTVFSRESPFRCVMIRGENPEMDERWTCEFVLWAFYSQASSTCRYFVQEVANPFRHRISQAPSTGSWSTVYQFNSFPAVRIAVFDAVGCDKHLERGKFAILPFKGNRGVHPPIDDLDKEDGTLWCRRFEFFGFQSRYPSTVKFSIARRKQPLETDKEIRDRKKKDLEKLSRVPPPDYPVYKLAMEGEGDLAEWDIVDTFYAFSVPMPGTTRYFLKVARKPTRFRISTSEFLGPWDTRISFYAYSTRIMDMYDPPKL